ncbi:DNA polymerase iota [Holothuria leucospilota]|uniref:DNA polymerase iota n=1 Tax=Holothuria leucospilota TaxID=206669 RepID=A0A9Q1H1Z6_HOLLE|nr:DNA polymerase iota [Holothuria leucospilota]
MIIFLIMALQMKRSWNELSSDDEADDPSHEQETEDWSASSAVILSPPSSKDTSQPYYGASSKCVPQAHSDQNEHKRTIVHVDLDCFYAQVEMIRNPELRTKPLGIQQKNIVVTCNYVAREYGVTKLMYIKDAKEKCPHLVLVSGEDLTHYREYSQRVSGWLQIFSSLTQFVC